MSNPRLCESIELVDDDRGIVFDVTCHYTYSPATKARMGWRDGGEPGDPEAIEDIEVRDVCAEIMFGGIRTNYEMFAFSNRDEEARAYAWFAHQYRDEIARELLKAVHRNREWNRKQKGIFA